MRFSTAGCLYAARYSCAGTEDRRPVTTWRTLARLLRAALLTLLLGAAEPIAAQTGPTGSAKFIPTFLIYYGGGPAFTAADAPKLAKFDLIDVDRFRYNSISPTTWAAVKSINPGTQFYLYEMGPEAFSYHDTTAQLYLNDLGRYNVSRGHPMGSLNGNHPGLFLPDLFGKRLYDLGVSNPAASQYSYLMDFGSTVYQSYWLTAVQADIVNQPWVTDGVFVDNCAPIAAAGKYSGTSAWYSTDAAWSSAMNSFVTGITGGLHGHSQKVWCNRGNTRSVNGSTAWLTLDGSATPPDVVLEEGAFAVGWGAAVQFYPEADWKRQVDTLAAIKKSKVAMLSHTQLAQEQAGTDNYGKPVTYWQALWYALGSFLLGKNDVLGNAYFMFNGAGGYNKIWWHDEYDHIDLGKALKPYTVTSVSGTNVYSREFQAGYVYVNPTPNDLSLTIPPGAYWQLTHGNLLSARSALPIVSSFSLKSHSAAILLKDTTPPSAPTALKTTAVSATQVSLSWNASTDNVGVKGYNVYKLTPTGTVVSTTTATSFQDSGLTPGATYAYNVRAFDAVPNYSAWASVQVKTPSPDTQAPSVPTGLSGTAVSPTQINLTWQASTDNVAVKGYYVYVNDVALATTGATSFQHTGLTPGVTYKYRVSSYDAVPNNSAWTAAVAVATASTLAARDPLKWPFASTSIWNMPIGSGATFAASGLHFNPNVASTSAEYWYDLPQADHERIVLRPTAPLTSVYINNAGWSGGDRCVQQGAVFFQAPIPANYVLPNSTGNNGAAILMADGKTITQTQPFTRCAGYAYATTMPVPWNLAMWQYDIKTGDGILGAHGGSSLSILGGTIRLGELRPGTQMRHALKVNVYSVRDLGLCAGNINNCYTWPAAAADSYAANAGSGYGSLSGNTNPYMKMGALLAIPSNVNIDGMGLQTQPGKMLAWTLQNYGAYIVDSRGSPGFDFSVEDGADGSKLTEFKTDFGFDFEGRLGYSTLKDSSGNPTPQAKWVSDVRLLIDNLRVVTNNTRTSVGGGGAPRQPLAPAFK